MILSESDLAKGQVTLETLDRPGPTFSCQYALRTIQCGISSTPYTEFVMVSRVMVDRITTYGGRRTAQFLLSEASHWLSGSQ